MKKLLFVGMTSFILSSCSLLGGEEIDTTHVKKITEEQAESCTLIEEGKKASSSHAFHHDDNVDRVWEEAKEITAKKGGNALLIQSHTMSFEFNTSKMLFDVYNCP